MSFLGVIYRSSFSSCCDNNHTFAKEQSDRKTKGRVVSARKKRSGLPENMLGRVSRKEGMAVLPHLKRMKNSPQISAPLCLIENPAFRHLHNCFSHSKLPHLDEKYKRLTFPSDFAESLDLKPDFSEGGLNRRNSYPKARVTTAENECNDLHSVPEKAKVPESHSKGHLIGRSTSETTAQSTSSSASNDYFLTDTDSPFAYEAETVEDRSQRQRNSGCTAKSTTQHDYAALRGRVSKGNNDTFQTMDHSTCPLEESYVDIPIDRLRRVSSHVSSKSSLQSIVE